MAAALVSQLWFLAITKHSCGGFRCKQTIVLKTGVAPLARKEPYETGPYPSRSKKAVQLAVFSGLKQRRRDVANARGWRGCKGRGRRCGLGSCVSFAEDYLLLSLLVFLSFALVLSLFAVLLLQNQFLSLWTCNANINLMVRFSSSLASHEMRPRVPFLIEDSSPPLPHG